MQTPRDLTTFAAFLSALEAAGIDYAVIGGCAVGAYARLVGSTITTVDLDLYVTDAAMADLLAWAPDNGVEVVKRPRPRSLPVAVLCWCGEEINALTRSAGLPDPEVVARTAREVELREAAVVARVADPFDLLANKLAVRRPKDLPHIEVLTRFCEEEATYAFEVEATPRGRIAPLRRLLRVLGSETLSEVLADRLVPLAGSDPVRLRFLVACVPRRDQAERLITQAPEQSLRSELARLRDVRTFAH